MIKGLKRQIDQMHYACPPQWAPSINGGAGNEKSLLLCIHYGT